MRPLQDHRQPRRGALATLTALALLSACRNDAADAAATADAAAAANLKGTPRAPASLSAGDLHGFDPQDPDSLQMQVVATGLAEPGIHTELRLALRPGKTGDLQRMAGDVIVSAGLRNAWGKFGGSWQDAIASKSQQLIAPDVDVAFDPEGRLVLQNAGTLLREATAGARDFAPWSPAAPWGAIAGGHGKLGQIAWDAAGRLHTVFTAHAPKWTPEENSLTRGYDELHHAVQQQDGSWTVQKTGLAGQGSKLQPGGKGLLARDPASGAVWLVATQPMHASGILLPWIDYDR